ncbi:MAG: hypothetical protein L0229_15065, partial [Blastocatellia bacterium]|nr:hypothetical protein [Blastocatellia bacterium]
MKKFQLAIIALAVFSLFITSAAGSLFSCPSAASPLPAPEDDERINTFVATESNQLIGFDITKPEEILCNMPITGLMEGEKINSLSREGGFRGADPEAILLLAATNQGRFYFVNTVTGLAFQIAPFRDFRLFIGEEFDATFLPMEADGQSGAFFPTDLSDLDGPSVITNDVVVVTPDGDKIVLNLLLKLFKESIRLAYKEGDRNFGKQPCITDISAEDGRLLGFDDKNNNALVEIAPDGSLTTISDDIDDERELQEILMSDYYDDPPSSDDDFLTNSDSREFAALLGRLPSAPASAESAILQGFEAAAADEIETEVSVISLETGDVIRIGSIKTDSPIRAVAPVRGFALEPDYAISAEQSTITLRRGEALKNFKININRLF